MLLFSNCFNDVYALAANLRCNVQEIVDSAAGVRSSFTNAFKTQYLNRAAHNAALDVWRELSGPAGTYVNVTLTTAVRARRKCGSNHSADLQR